MAKQRFRDIKKGQVAQAKPKEEKQKHIYYARKGDIIKAFLTDSFMLLMPIMYIVFYVVFGGREGFGAHKMLGWFYILLPLAIVEILFLLKNAQTPGMKAYGLKLIFMPTGKKPPLATIMLRQILSKLTFLLFAWIILFFRKDGRNLHDLIAGTAIVYEQPNS